MQCIFVQSLHQTTFSHRQRLIPHSTIVTLKNSHNIFPIHKVRYKNSWLHRSTIYAFTEKRIRNPLPLLLLPKSSYIASKIVRHKYAISIDQNRDCTVYGSSAWLDVCLHSFMGIFAASIHQSDATLLRKARRVWSLQRFLQKFLIVLKIVALLYMIEIKGAGEYDSN